jgi:hypothetical protein
MTTQIDFDNQLPRCFARVLLKGETSIERKNLINSDCATILESTFSGVPKGVMKRLLTQKKNKHLGAYPPELRSFALTLKFYSTKVYSITMCEKVLI